MRRRTCRKDMLPAMAAAVFLISGGVTPSPAQNHLRGGNATTTPTYAPRVGQEAQQEAQRRAELEKRKQVLQQELARKQKELAAAQQRQAQQQEIQRRAQQAAQLRAAQQQAQLRAQQELARKQKELAAAQQRQAQMEQQRKAQIETQKQALRQELARKQKELAAAQQRQAQMEQQRKAQIETQKQALQQELARKQRELAAARQPVVQHKQGFVPTDKGRSTAAATGSAPATVDGRASFQGPGIQRSGNAAITKPVSLPPSTAQDAQRRQAEAAARQRAEQQRMGGPMTTDKRLSTGGFSTITAGSTPATIGGQSAFQVPTTRTALQATKPGTGSSPISADEKAQMEARIERMKRILSSDVPPSPKSTSNFFSRNIPGGNLEEAQRAWEVANQGKDRAKVHLAKAEESLRSGDIQGYKQELDQAMKLALLSSQTGSAAAEANVAGINVQLKVVRETAKAAISGTAFYVAGPAGKAVGSAGTIGLDYMADFFEGGSNQANKNLPGNVFSTGVGTLAGVGAQKAGGAVVDRMIESKSLLTQASGETFKEIGSGSVGRITTFAIEKWSAFGTKRALENLENKGRVNAPKTLEGIEKRPK